MRRKKKRSYSMETIVLSLIILPPLGFFLLWGKARTRRSKSIVIIAFLVFLALVAAALFMLDIPSRLKGPVIPPEGFDITYNSRGGYNTPKILPFEWKIFNEVVQEMRRLQPEYTVPDTDILSIEMVQPEYKALERVTDRHDMEYEDVKGIYLKVSTQLAGVGKKK